MIFLKLRTTYHQRVCAEIIRVQPGDKSGYPNFADKSNKASKEIARHIILQMDCTPKTGHLAGQTAGKRFEEITRDYLKQTFARLHHIRPGKWQYSTGQSIANFEQYEHLAFLDSLVATQKELASALGKEHIIKPDIIIARFPVSDDEINAAGPVVTDISLSSHTPLRATNNSLPILHASISCKWTLRNDRSQNTRSEALSLIRHRKGHTPHIVAVTAEPLPTRIAALALGTGDIDCVYHFALYELENAIRDIGNEDQLDMLQTLIDGRRLRDISDLPFDLAI
ncbi:MAG: restriction endonuclease [Chloroflexi bacterium]|nr:restriction endonuclease [Chloroflexota bacterium]